MDEPGVNTARDVSAGPRWPVMAGLAALFLVAIVPVLPMIDFYDHLSRYFVLSHLDANGFLRQNYQSAWGILPNIGLDVLGTGLMKVAAPLAVAHIIVLVIFAIQYFGVLFFNRQLSGKPSLLVGVLTVPLLYSFIFTWGFANFLLGLGLVFWAAGVWIALRRKPLLAALAGSLFAVVIFLTHGVAFALYGLLVGALELGFLWKEKRLQLGPMARSAALLGVQAVAPVLLFTMSATSKAPEGFTNADESVRRLAHAGRLADRLRDLAVYRLETIWRVAETPVAWLDAASFLIALGVLAALIVRGRVRLDGRVWAAIALGVVLVALVPPTLFGVGYIADRMPLFLAFTTVGALVADWRNTRFDRICQAALVLLVIARLAVIGVGWQRYRDDFDAYLTATRAMPPGHVVMFVNAAREDRLDPRPRCEMFGPLMIPLRGQAAPLFAYGSQQPIKLAGALKSAQEGQPTMTGPRPIRFQDDRIAVAARLRRFDYVLVCDAERLSRPLPAGAEVVSHAGRFTVVKIAKPTAPT
ncbi:MAG: hypothetical protein ACXWKR_15945 [Phenylobacterium sp.]